MPLICAAVDCNINYFKPPFVFIKYTQTGYLNHFASRGRSLFLNLFWYNEYKLLKNNATHAKLAKMGAPQINLIFNLYKKIVGLKI